MIYTAGHLRDNPAAFRAVLDTSVKSLALREDLCENSPRYGLFSGCALNLHSSMSEEPIARKQACPPPPRGSGTVNVTLDQSLTMFLGSGRWVTHFVVKVVKEPTVRRSWVLLHALPSRITPCTVVWQSGWSPGHTEQGNIQVTSIHIWRRGLIERTKDEGR
jgi:hypothetical protein